MGQTLPSDGMNGNLDEPEKKHCHLGDLGLVSLIAYYFCIAAFVAVRMGAMGEGLSSEGALIFFLAFEGALSLSLLLLAMAGPYFLRHDHRGRISIVSGVLMSMGFAFSAIESFTGFSNAPLRLVLVGVSGCGYALCLLVWGRILSVKEPGSSSRQVLVDTCAAIIVVAVALSLPEMASLVLVACLGLFTGVAGMLRAVRVDDTDPHAKQVVVSDTRMAIPWSSYVAGGALWMVCSVFWALLDGKHVLSGRPSVGIVVLLIVADVAVIFIAGRRRRSKVDLSKVFWVSLPLLAVGAVIFAAGDQRILQLSAILIAFSLIVSHMYLMAHFAAVAHRPKFLPDQMSAWGWLTPHVGMFLGLLAGLLSISVGDAATRLLLPIMVGAIVAVAIAMMQSLSIVADHRREKASAAKADEHAEAKDAVDIEAHVDEVFTAFGLTRREKEVASLLLQGRSQGVIASLLFISPGTVNTHIKHIYRKAGVGSKQEFIDLSQ